MSLNPAKMSTADMLTYIVSLAQSTESLAAKLIREAEDRDRYIQYAANNLEEAAGCCQQGDLDELERLKENLRLALDGYHEFHAPPEIERRDPTREEMEPLNATEAMAANAATLMDLTQKALEGDNA